MILLIGTRVLNLANVLEWRVGVNHMDGAEYEKIWLYVLFSHDRPERQFPVGTMTTKCPWHIPGAITSDTADRFNRDSENYRSILERVRKDLLRRCTDILTEAMLHPLRDGAVDFYARLNQDRSIDGVMMAQDNE